MTPEEILTAISFCEEADVPRFFAKLAERTGPEEMRRLYFDNIGVAPANQEIKLMRACDFIKSVGPLPPMVVQGLIPSRSVTLLTGKPKFGKTLLALDLADSICNGEMVFDNFMINRPGPVVYLGMEDADIETAGRLTKRGLDDRRPLFLTPQRFTISTSDGMDTLHRLYNWVIEEEKQEPSLVIVDTARESLGIKEWNDPAEVADKIRPLREGFARQKCSLLLIGHNRKQVADADGDEIAGSNAFASSVDGWISDKRMEKMENGNRRHYISVVGRSDMNGEYVLEMDTETLKFTMVGDDEVRAEKSAQLKAKRAERLKPVAEAVKNCGGAATIPELAHELSMTIEGVRVKVNHAVADGFMEEAGKAKAAGDGTKPVTQFRMSATYTNPK